MKLSLGLVTAMSINESLSLAKAAEKSGYHRIWLGEDVLHRDVFTYLSILALNTDRIGVATGITSPYVRSREVFDASVKAVAELAGGRFALGVGQGGLPEVRKLTGTKAKNPLSVLESTASRIKEKTGLEVYFGVRGPKMLSLAGRVADGVLLSGPKSYLKKAMERVEGSSGGRYVQKVLWNAFILGGAKSAATRITDVMRKSMPSYALEDMSGEPENELCIYGSEERILEELRGFQSMGVDEFVVGPPYGENPLKVIEELGRLWNSE